MPPSFTACAASVSVAWPEMKMVGSANPIRLHLAEEREPVDLAEPDVEHHQVDDAFVQYAHGRGRIVGGHHVHALRLQRDLDRAADVLLVVEHENGGLAGDRGCSSATSRQAHDEAGRPARSRITDLATVLDHDLLHDRKAQTHVVLAALARTRRDRKYAAPCRRVPPRHRSTPRCGSVAHAVQATRIESATRRSGFASTPLRDDVRRAPGGTASNPFGHARPPVSAVHRLNLARSRSSRPAL